MTSQNIDPELALAALPGWQVQFAPPALSRRFKFTDFAQAFAFMTRCAETANQLDHHPEWTNVYNRVDVVLTTHDTGGITALDLALARAMDAAYSALTDA